MLANVKYTSIATTLYFVQSVSSQEIGGSSINDVYPFLAQLTLTSLTTLISDFRNYKKLMTIFFLTNIILIQFFKDFFVSKNSSLKYFPSERKD